MQRLKISISLVSSSIQMVSCVFRASSSPLACMTSGVFQQETSIRVMCWVPSLGLNHYFVCEFVQAISSLVFLRTASVTTKTAARENTCSMASR